MAERTIGSGAGVTLAADEDGDGPPVVLLHGLTATRRYVVMGSRRLQRTGHRVVAYDARGHGASSPAPAATEYGYERLAGDLLAVLDGLAIERAVLAGASMGAHTALRVALDAPERVAAVVAITPGFDPDDHDRGARLARWDALAAALREDGVEGFAREFGEDRVAPPWRAAVGRALRQRMALHASLEAVADALVAVPRSAPFGDLGDLRAVRCPALVVGSRDGADPGHPLALAERYAAALPRARLAVEDEGESPLAWQGARLSRLIAELAARAR